MLSPTPSINRPSLHPAAGYFIGPRVPHGLAAVVEGLTREVLRHRPEDIYVFAAHHFEKLLKLREQHHAEKYRNIREFDDNVSRDFNLWPTKESGDTRVSANSGWSLDKESKDFERRGKMSTDVEESPEDVSTDREKRKISKQTCTRSSGAKRASRKSTKDPTSDPCATKIIPQMSALRGSSRTILTKDIKQELRKNKLNSGEKGKMSDSMEKGIRGERRSKTKISKTDKSVEEEIERAAMTTASRTSSRRPLKKVRRIETESETETEREIATKDRLGNGYERVGVKGDSANREAVSDCIRSRSRRSEAAAWPSEHSSERKVSSRALSMDRIRAYVLRKFASTASLEVLRSPTYVEQVQEVIDRAAPIIKEKLEEIRRPRGKRSRSVDFAWNEESFRRCVAKDSRRCDDRDEEEKSKRKSSNGALEQESAEAKGEDKSEDQSTTRDDANPMENGEKPPRRRSAGSGRRSRRRESAGHNADDDPGQSNKPEPEPGRDTLEARLTATQSILEGISMSASELNGARKVDPLADERGEPSSEASDHVNMVSLPIVRPPSSRSCRNATKNGSDSLVLPPISPEAPRSTKKKDELSLPILSAAPNGSHSAKRSQEQDGSKDAEEASTMCDITSDMDDIAVLPEDEDGQMIAKRDSMSDHQNLMSDTRVADEEEGEEDKDAEEALWKDTPRELAGKRVSDVSLDRDLEEYRESTAAQERRAEEIYKDSLNVTPEVAEVPSRPDSLEPDEDERDKLEDEDGDAIVQKNRFDDLKDRLIEVEMAERNIEKALAGQQTATHDDETMSIEEMDEARKSTGEDVVSEVEKSMSEQGTPKEEGKSMNGEEKEEEESANKVERGSNDAEGSTDGRLMSSEERKSLDEEEEKEELTNGTEGNDNVERLKNGRGISSEERKLSEEEEEEKKSTIEPESPTAMANEELIEKKESKAQVGVQTKEAEKIPNGVEEVMVKRHVQKLESANTQYKIRNDQIVHGTRDKEDMTGSNGVILRENVSSQATGSRNTADEHLETSLPTEGSDVDKTKSRKKRETNELPATTPLSLKIPFSYVLSEGSPCEIPDSVTTVIIPDRPCPSPVIDIENLDQPGSTYLPIESTAHDNIVEDVSSRDEETRQGEDCVKYGMEAFGEYIRPEVVPADFVQSARSGQDIVIIHQDLDRIKEEGEEDEEAEENDERREAEDLEKKDDAGQAEETVKLEDIAEHEENETIPDEVLSSCVPGSKALAETTKSTDLTNADKTDVAEESRSMLDNSSEENGSSQDIHTTTTSSEAKESTASIENSSVGRPIVPELNLDSLQDNTVSSFKMTANGTATKESNCSPKESDATMFLVEPLTPDEKLSMGNRLVLADRELETPVEELVLSSPNFRLQSDVPEADQLYPAEHAEYELLEKDPLSREAILEDETEAQEEDAVNLKASAETACVDSTSRKKRETEELDSEEEIARELIGLLDKEAQFHAGEEESPQDKPTESNLHVDDGSNRPLLDSVHSVDETEEDKNCVLPERSGKLDNESVSRTEATNEISDHIAGSRKNEAEDKIANEETEDSRLEAEEMKHAESKVASLEESERNESSAKDNATNKETEEPEEEIEGEKHTEISQVAPLAEFERDELLEKNGSHETANEKIVVENERDVIDADLANARESSEDKRIDVEDALKSHSSEITSKTEEPHEKREESDHEEHEDWGEFKGTSVEVQEECQEEELNNEGKCERNELVHKEDDKENMEVQESTKSSEDSLKKSTEKDEDAGHDETAPIKPITPEEFIADDQKDETSEKEEKVDDLLAKLENVHGPITNALSEQSTRDDHHIRRTMGTKSSTAETVIAVFDSSADEKTKSLGDGFLPAVVKTQACIRGFLARRRLRKNLCTDSVPEDVALAQKTAVASNEYLPVPEENSNLRETKCGRHRLRREEALRKTTLSLENAFATSRLQHTGEFHDSVPLPLFDMTHSETNSDDSLNESLDDETEEEPPKTDTAKSSGTTDSNCHDDECREGSQKSDTFADHSGLPIMMQLLADATRNCHFRINSDPNVGASGAKLMEPALDFLMLGYPRDDTTLQNRYLNFITSVEDIGSNMDYLPSDVRTKGRTNANDAQPSVASGDASMPESLREPLALPGTPQGVVIEELTSLDEPTAGDVSSTKSESMKASSATKTSLDTNSSVPLEECVLEERKNSESSITRANSADKDNAIADQKDTVEEAGAESGDASVVGCNSQNVGEVGLHGENMSERSCAIFHDSNGHASGGEDEKM